MTLNSSGPISFGGSTTGQSINLEIGASASATISLNSSAVRTLANVTANNSAITVPTNFYGKTASNAIANNIMRYLVVAGGGSGGAYAAAGGGGAGGLLTGCLTFNSGTTIRITANVGNGGGTGPCACSKGFNGNASLFYHSASGNVTSISTVGGGGGAGGGVGGSAGGSGGGGGRSQDSSGQRAGGLGTSGQGNNGGTTPSGFNCAPSSGGGGAGGLGLAPTTNTAGGAGGVGRQITIAGATSFYAGGGGGKICSSSGSGGAGGQGGGGAGTNQSGFQGGNGTPNLGGGGGAVGFQAALGGKPGTGGSGVVIIDYASPTALFTVTGGGANTRGNYVCSGTTATRQWIKFTSGNSIATK